MIRGRVLFRNHLVLGIQHAHSNGAIPAIADQTTLMYVLHLGVGDDFIFTPDGHPEVRLRIGDQELTSIITRGSAERLRLKVGDQVFAVIKSTEVMIGLESA